MKVVSLGVKADEEETGVSSASSGLGLGKELELEDGRRNEGAEDPKQLSDVAAAEDSPEAVEVAVANAAEAGGMRVTEFVIAGKEGKKRRKKEKEKRKKKERKEKGRKSEKK